MIFQPILDGGMINVLSLHGTNKLWFGWPADQQDFDDAPLFQLICVFSFIFMDFLVLF